MVKKPSLEERVETLEKLCCILAVKMIEKFGSNQMIDDLYDKVMELITND